MKLSLFSTICGTALLISSLLPGAAQANEYSLQETRRDRAEIVSDLIAPLPARSQRIVVRCQQSASSSSTIRELIGSHRNQQILTIEIEGNCEEDSVSSLPPVIVVPYPQSSYPQSPLPEDIEQLLEEYKLEGGSHPAPWIIRPSSGWHWLLRN